jgi:hypothetical protein
MRSIAEGRVSGRKTQRHGTRGKELANQSVFFLLFFQVCEVVRDVDFSG